jgi:hypothetical protein
LANPDPADDKNCKPKANRFSGDVALAAVGSAQNQREYQTFDDEWGGGWRWVVWVKVERFLPGNQALAFAWKPVKIFDRFAARCARLIDSLAAALFSIRGKLRLPDS